MKKWMKRLKSEGNLLGKEKILLIPRRQMRHSFERVVLQDVSSLMQVEFMTFYEWVLSVTAGYRYRHGLREITHLEQVQFVLNSLQEVDETILTSGQKNLATAEAILQDLTLIRLNNLDIKVVNQSMRETMEKLLLAYDEYLQSNHLYDYAQLLKWINDDPELLQTVTEEVKDSQISIYPNEELSKREKNLLKQFNFEALAEITKDKVSSLMSYGLDNGVAHMLEKVLDEEIPFDEVCLVYTDSAQLPEIHQVIERMDLPATFAEGTPIANTPTYAFFNTLIDYALTDGPLVLFKKLVDDGQIKIKDVNRLSSLFNYFVGKDGMTFAKRFKPIAKQALTDRRWTPDYILEQAEDAHLLIDRMEEITNKIEALQAGTLTEAIEILLEISDEIYHKNSKEKNIEYQAIKQALEAFYHYPSKDSSATELRTVLEIIKGQNIMSSTEQPGHIHVTSLDNLGLIYREHYAWFGLATDEFQVKSNRRSPFISEEEFIKAELVTDISYFKILETRLENLIKQSDANHSLYFNYFNTVDIREKNPIALWSEFDPYKNRGDASREKSDILAYPINGLEDEKPDNILETLEEPSQAELADLSEFRFSPSSAIELTKCSRKFMYEKVMGIKLSKQEEIDHQTWLPHNLKGTLYHELLEVYEREKLLAPVSLEEVVDGVFASYAAQYPALYAGQIEEEKTIALAALQRYDALDWSDWDVKYIEEELEGMIKFTKDDFHAEALKKDEYSIKIKGFADKVDMQEIDGETKYRVIDYKTGSKKNVNVLQLVLYEKMIEELIAEEKDEQVDTEGHFYFVLDEKESDRPFEVEDQDKLRENKQKQVTDFLVAMQEFAEDWDQVEFKKNAAPCIYCDFLSLCKIREGEKNDQDR